MNNLAKHLDLANHQSISTAKEIEQLCQNVLKYGFHSAFVNPCWVRLAKICLRKNHQPPALTPKVGTVIAFPLGQETTAMKIYNARRAIEKGADELDISTNIGWLKSGKEKLYLKEMKLIVLAAKKIRQAVVVKFIIETGHLTEEEIKKASWLVLRSKADFIKTCSGLGPRGAEIKDVKIIRSAIKNQIKIKVAGGIGVKAKALEFISAGADRIGTSKAVQIVNEK